MSRAAANRAYHRYIDAWRRAGEVRRHAGRIADTPSKHLEALGDAALIDLEETLRVVSDELDVQADIRRHS
jgi:hypothetical protein